MEPQKFPDIIKVIAKPNSKKTGIICYSNEKRAYKVAIHAQPEHVKNHPSKMGGM